MISDDFAILLAVNLIYIGYKLLTWNRRKIYMFKSYLMSPSAALQQFEECKKHLERPHYKILINNTLAYAYGYKVYYYYEEEDE
jgi:hypothetical protein